MFAPFQEELNNKRIKTGNRNEIEPQEILLDGVAQKRSEQFNSYAGKMEVLLPLSSLYGLLFFSLLFLLILFGRSFHLQVIRGEEFANMAERNKFSFSMIQSSRGVIYDKNGEQLVFNRPAFYLVLNRAELPDEGREGIMAEAAAAIGMNYDDIEKILESSDPERERVAIKEIDDHKNLVLLEVKVKNLSGIEIEKRVERDYVDGEIFSHILGYLGRISPEDMEFLGFDYSPNDNIGKSGLERYYEDFLRVSPGKIKIERDALGRPKSEEVISMPRSGNSLILSIDSELQRKIYRELDSALQNLGSWNAAAVAMDPRTGEVLSLVSYPGFDSNAFSGKKDNMEELFNDPRKPLFNRAMSGLYPVGSAIKPLIAAAALEERIVSPEKQFFSAGYISVPNPWNPSEPSIFRDWQPHGWVDLRRAIAVSSNVYFYIVGGGYENQKGLGAALIKKYLNLFGWGEKTGIDLPGERGGFIPDPEWKKETKNESWTVGDTYNISIGQGDILVTPLQVAAAYNAVANGGSLMKPMVVKEIIDENGNKARISEPEIAREDFISPESLRIAREGMRDAVRYGSAVSLNSLPVQAAAKTGTAQIPKGGHYHNWVSVFAPYDDPEIVLVLIIEEVEGMRPVVLPVAKEVLEWYFKESKSGSDYEE